MLVRNFPSNIAPDLKQKLLVIVLCACSWMRLSAFCPSASPTLVFGLMITDKWCLQSSLEGYCCGLHSFIVSSEYYCLLKFFLPGVLKANGPLGARDDARFCGEAGSIMSLQLSAILLYFNREAGFLNPWFTEIYCIHYLHWRSSSDS